MTTQQDGIKLAKLERNAIMDQWNRNYIAGYKAANYGLANKELCERLPGFNAGAVQYYMDKAADQVMTIKELKELIYG